MKRVKADVPNDDAAILVPFETAIEALPPLTRVVFLLHRVDDHSYDAIARRLSISIPAVESCLAAALYRMCCTLDGNTPERAVPGPLAEANALLSRRHRRYCRALGVMASDHVREGEPDRGFAERRGITFRERVAEIIRKVAPEKVRGMFDGLRLKVTAPEPQAQAPQESPTAVRDRTIIRHARVVQAIFAMQDRGGDATPDQLHELGEARRDLNGLREHAAALSFVAIVIRFMVRLR